MDGVPGYGSLLAHAGLVGAMFEQVDLIGVRAAHHGFETVDDTDVAREGVRRSIAWWAQALG